MCGCSSGNATIATRSFATRSVPPIDETQQSDCVYTLDQVNSWLEKVTCFKDKGLYTTMPNITQAQLVNYRGILLSTLNYPTNVCYFKKQLDEIKSFVTVILSTGQC